MSDNAKGVAGFLGIVTALAFANLAVETLAAFELRHGLTTVAAIITLALILAGVAAGLYSLSKPTPPAIERVRRLKHLEQQGELAALRHEWEQETHERNRNDPR
jgi:hypothetical protein